LSGVLDALLHLDGEVRRHAEPRFLVEATLARLAVESGAPVRAVGAGAAVIPVPAVPMPAVPVPAVPLPAPSRAAPAATSSPGADERPPQAALPVDGWADVLEKLNRTVRAAYLDAQPEVGQDVLVLWFRYGFHHKKAQEQSSQLMPHVRAWLGDGVKVDFRLREADAPATKPASPEDDPFVREIVRRFDGRVTRVKEVSE
jgi:hypothetical protein